MASLFWVSGSTVYDGVTNRLATTSGGTATVAVIGSADTVTFDANSPAAAAVTTSAAISCSTLTLASGFTGSLTMSNSLTATGAVTLTQGTLNLGGQTCNWASFANSTTINSTLNFGTAASITLTGTSAAWNVTTAHITLSGTATITLTGAGSNFSPTTNSSWTGVSLIMNGSGASSCSAGALANLTRTGTATLTDSLNLSATTLTIPGTTTLGGNTTQGANRLMVQSNTIGTQRTLALTGGAVVINGDVDFQDIAITGSPSWTNTGSAYVGDCGGNSGLTTTVSATQTWSGTSGGNWSTNAWSGRAPLPQDDVVVSSAFIATQTISSDMPRLGRSLDFSGVTGAVNWSGVASLTNFSYGSLTLATAAGGMTTGSLAGNSNVLAGRGNFTMTTGGITQFGRPLTINAPSGTYTVTDAWNSFPNVLSLQNGTFNDNGKVIKVGVSSSATFQMGGGILNATGTWNIGTSTATSFWNVTGGTVNASTVTINLTLASTVTRTFAGGGNTYGTLTYTVANSPGLLAITGNNTFNTINVGSGTQLQFPASGTQTITGAFNVNGVNNGYQRLPGVASNYISTPDSAALEVTGDIDLRIELSLDNWAQATAPAFIAKWTAGQLAYEFYLVTTGGGVPHLAISRDGTTSNDYGATTNLGTPAGGTIKWIRVTRATATGFVNFYTSPDGVTWTQLGATVSGVTGNLFAGTSTLFIGSNSTSGAQAIGNIYRAQVYNGIAGTLVFDADFTSKAVGANSFTESSVNAATVTINGVLAQAGDGRLAVTSSTPGVASTLKASSAWNVGINSVLVSGNTGLALAAGSIDYDTFQDITGMATVALSQVGATVTATGGTQVTVTNATLAQLAATLTATGGVQTVTASISIALAQLAATLTATGGTQVSLTNASVVQLNATLTTTGGVQATAQGVALAQVAGAVTASGGTQIGGIGVISAQVGASLTATGGVQVVIAPRIVTIAQLAAGLTVTGGVQAILGTSFASMAQTGGHLTATGGVPTVGAATFTLVPMNILDSTIANDTIASESSNTEIDSSSTNINIAS